jgi:hypothetical protein
MQREYTNKPGTAKADPAHKVTLESASVWSQHYPNSTPVQRPGLSAGPAQDWTRYIDSRLKQFCTR